MTAEPGNFFADVAAIDPDGDFGTQSGFVVTGFARQFLDAFGKFFDELLIEFGKQRLDLCDRLAQKLAALA